MARGPRSASASAVVAVVDAAGHAARPARGVLPRARSRRSCALVDALMAFPDILLAIFLVAALGAPPATSCSRWPSSTRRASAAWCAPPRWCCASCRSSRRRAAHRRLDAAHPVGPYPAERHVAAAGAGHLHLRLRGAGRGGLSFLGAGVPPDIADLGHHDRLRPAICRPARLGGAVSRHRHRARRALPADSLGDGLRDMLDPKLRKAL